MHLQLACVRTGGRVEHGRQEDRHIMSLVIGAAGVLDIVRNPACHTWVGKSKVCVRALKSVALATH